MRLVRPEGLEPPTYCFEGSRSIQLSYGRTTRRIAQTGNRGQGIRPALLAGNLVTAK